MCSDGEFSNSLNTIESSANNHSGNRVSRKGHHYNYAMPLNRVSNNLRNEKSLSSYGSDQNSVYCFGDGPPVEPIINTVQPIKKQSLETFDNRENSEKKTESNTTEPDKRKRLLDWLKASQAKRDENNRQVFSRWLDKLDTERSLDPQSNIKIQENKHSVSFYCDRIPPPYALYSAMQNCSGGLPTVYVGIPPSLNPYQSENLNFVSCCQTNSSVLSSSPFVNGVCPINPSMTQTGALVNDYTISNEVGSTSEYNNESSKIELNETNISPTKQEQTDFHSLSSSQSSELSVVDDNSINTANNLILRQSVLPLSKQTEFVTAPVMISVPYGPYSCNQAQRIGQPTTPNDSLTEYQNIKSCQNSSHCMSNNSPFLPSSDQFPTLVNGQSEPWKTGSIADPIGNYRYPSTHQLPLGAYNQYPQLNRYFYPVLPGGMNHPTAGLGSPNYLYNHGNSSVSSTLNFNLQHWISLLDDVNKDYTRGSPLEQSNSSLPIE